MILAAGKGVRMRSLMPKVLHPILGRPMVQYVIDTVRELGAEQVDLIIGYGGEQVSAALAGQHLGFVWQRQQLGTGHALQCWANERAAPPGTVLVVCGDTPLLSLPTLRRMLECHRAKKPAATMMTMVMKDPGSYGRVLRDRRGRVIAIREAKDCTADQLAVSEVNLAVYLFSGPLLVECLPRLDNQNRQGEYYLTDIIGLLASAGHRIEAVVEGDETSTLGINSRVDLALVAGLIGDRVKRGHLEAGVGIDDPRQVTIEPTVTIGSDTRLLPGVVLCGDTRIGTGCMVGPNVELRDAVLGDRVNVSHTVVRGTAIPADSTVGPFVILDGRRRSGRTS